VPAFPFETAIEHLRDAVFLLSPGVVVSWANRAALTAVGRSAIVGQPFTRFLTPASAELAERAIEAETSGDLLELDFVKPDLTAMRLEVQFSRISPECVAAVGRPLNGRAELAARNNKAEFQALQFQAALVELACSDHRSLPAQLRHITGVAASVLDIACVAVWLFNPERTKARRIHLYDREQNRHSESGVEIEVAPYPRHFEALEQARVIAAEDALRDPLTCELADDYLIPSGTVSILDVPVRWGGRTVGVLCHEHKVAGQLRHWRQDERNFAASLADLTALALESERRRNAESALRKSLEQLELFFSQSLDGFFIMMLDEPVRWDGSAAMLDYVFDHERMVKCNDALLRQYGWSRDTLLGTTPRQLFEHDPEHGRDLWRGMLNAGRLHVESNERRADGSRMRVEGDYICFLDAEGRVTGHFGIQRDVTDRVEAEEKLKRYNRRLTLLQQMDHAILSASSTAGAADDIVHAALARMRELVPANLGVQILAGEEPAPVGAKSQLTVPVEADGDRIGVLHMASDQSHAFSNEDHEVATEVANSLAVAIRHARLTDQIARHAAELEERVAERTEELSRANASLRDSEERLAGIFDSAIDAILVIDQGRRIVLRNVAASKVFGAAPASVDQLLGEELARLVRDYVASGGTAGPVRAPDEGMVAVSASGERFPVEASLSRFGGPGGGTLFSLTLRDVNEKKLAEERLEELRRQNIYLQDEIRHEWNFEQIVVGSSAVMQRVYASIEMVANTDATVLLLGETGTGKELVARAVHNRSRRRQSAMIKVNCGALPANLVESELFGHERGAFTGAVAQKKGRFELANRGTIFLDEVGELPLDAQVRLLRVLQEQELERVGGTQTLRVDVRVIAATNRDLKEELKQGAFRADLYYRLNVFPIEIPPLRECREDIAPLAAHFVRKFSDRMGKRVEGIRKDALHQMQLYDWPGNVRELANVLERAVILCQGATLDAGHLGSVGASTSTAASLVPTSNHVPTMEESERRLILDALKRTGGVLAGPSGAAQLLGMNRSTLWSRMRKLGIGKTDFVTG